MDDIIFSAEPEEDNEGNAEDGTISSEEEAFIQGYSEEEEVITCDECGVALRGDFIKKSFDGETHRFCSPGCTKEFEESLD